MARLSARQQRFVAEYATCANASEAARRAGYSANGAKVTACRLLTNPNLQAAIAEEKQRQAQKIGIERDDVIAAMNRAFMIAVEQQNPAAMVAAAREIGRLCGFYAPESILQAESSPPVRFMPQPELLRQLAASGDFRHPDGSLMDDDAVLGFYRRLSQDELLALAEGRAVVETRVVMVDGLGQVS